MANLTKSLIVLPNSQEYEFVGKHWFGTCTTAASTQIKSVSITGGSAAGSQPGQFYGASGIGYELVYIY